ncbi:MAG: Rne/Rng family ribonuclease [Planctomycetota bacterium]
MPKTEMLINHVPGEECRIAVIEDGKLEEFYQERASTESHVSNIYKGRVTNVEPAIQAAFVDFGLERNGFLHISDLHPKYFPGKDREEFEKVGHKTARHERPPIQKCLKRGQEVLVQVLKEGIGTKGPTLTSYLSIPGRFLVMMPDMQKHGVSRKVDDDEARREMRDILKTLDPPKEFGFIVRTAGIGQTKTDLKRDLSYLQRLWKNIERKRKGRAKTAELYAESDLVIRTIRDVFNSDIDRIVVDDPVAAARARDFLAVANPRTKSKVVYYDDPVPLFHRLGIEQQLDHMNAREVPLPSGGALVIDQTEALVAIDVNSGKSRAARDAETNAYKTNLEAVDEIARQLRLRDLGGLVVLDLIDMRPLKNRKTVETRFRNNLKKDRARTRVGPISQFGLLEMTRQRMRPSLKTSIYQECHHCNGRGYSMSPESVILSVMRRLALVMHRDDVARIELTISPDVAFHILNRKRGELVHLEKQYGKTVMVRVGGSTIDHVHIEALSDKGVALHADPETYLKRLKPADESSFRELDDLELPLGDDDQGEPVEAGQETPDPANDDTEPSTPEALDAPGQHSRGIDGPDDDADENENDDATPPDPDGSAEAPPPSPRRRRRRGGRGRSRRSGDDAPPAEAEAALPEKTADPESSAAPRDDADENESPETSHDAPENQPAIAEASSDPSTEASDRPDAVPKKGRRRRSRSKKKTTPTENNPSDLPDAAADADGNPDAPAAEAPSRSRSKRPAASKNTDNEGQKTRRRRSRAAGDDAKSKTKSKPRRQKTLPLDEHGDVDGNVKPAENPAPAENNHVEGNPPTTPAKKPFVKPGRGYANRIVNG